MARAFVDFTWYPRSVDDQHHHDDCETRTDFCFITITLFFFNLDNFTFLFSDAAYNFAFSLASSAILIPYVFSAFYQVKVAKNGIGYNAGERRTRDLIIGAVASI